MKIHIGKMIVNVVGGSGVMGGVHKALFEKEGCEVIISGRTSEITPEEAAKKSDVTIITVPIDATEETIRKIAPHCSAIMDFTSLKEFPVKAMLGYSKEDCEVAGLHPLYGDVDSVKERTMIYCPTSRSGEKCRKIIEIFKSQGLKIREMSPEEHDLIIPGVLQGARTIFLEAYANLIRDAGLRVEDVYELSPPPTKVILDLIARQVDEKSDELYASIKSNNKFTEKIKKEVLESLQKVFEESSRQEIRKFFGSELENSQKRAKKYVD